MKKSTRLLLLAILILAILNAGCIGFIRDSYRNYTSTPAPSATLPGTPTTTPINQTIERQYLFAERLNSGLVSYNNGIITGNASKKAADAQDWQNATLEIGMAKAYMEQASAAFIGMRPYAVTPDEINLSIKWNETVSHQIQAFEYMNLSYQETAYQSARGAEANYIKQTYYAGQANMYIGLARASREEAIALERKTFIGQQGQII